MSSLIAVLGFADLGIGNGLLNAISAASGLQDNQAIRTYISSALAALGCVSLALCIFSLLISESLPVGQFFKIQSSQVAAEAKSAIRALLVCFALSICTGLVPRIQAALQLGFLSNLWQIAGSLATLSATLVVIHLQLGLPWLALAILGTPIVVTWLNACLFFSSRFGVYRPALKWVSRTATGRIMKTGLYFLALQAAAAMAFDTDLLIITRSLGAEAVANYAIPDRLFSIIPALAGLVLAPLWPAYGEAMARGDIVWVRSTLKRSLRATILGSFTLALLFGILFRPIASVWLDQKIAAPIYLLVGIGAWKVMQCSGMAIASFLNGAGHYRLQVKIALPMAAAAILLKIRFVDQFGIAGAAWGTVVAYGLFGLIPLSVVIRTLLRKLQDSAAPNVA